MSLALQQVYGYQDAHTIWEALRVWLNGEPLPGWRFTPFWSNALMLLCALVFIFLLELLLTIGIQVWERRVLGRMQSRRGPSVLGNISSPTMLKVVLPIVVLLAIPAVLYGIEYWTARLAVADAPYLTGRTILFTAGIASGAALVIWVLTMIWEARDSLLTWVARRPPWWVLIAVVALLAVQLALRRLLAPQPYVEQIVLYAKWAAVAVLVVYLLTLLVVNRPELGKSAAREWRRLLWLAMTAWLCAGLYTGAVCVFLALKPTFPYAFPGGTLGYATVGCTFLAFLIYLVYFFGYYWRQGFADALKLFTKEDVVPLNADRFLFTLAPMLVYLPALLSWIVIPFGVAIIGGHYCYYMVQDLNVGLLLIIADFALFLVAIIMSGYASNNKYALAGAMREAAMLLTYEVPMLMSLLCVALFAGSLNLTEIVQRQTMTWAILPLLPAFVIYLVVSLAETNRPPFDLPEAQNELLGGYLVEYSGIRFALFYVAEYSNIFIVSAIMATCFLGGWKGPMFLGPDGLWLTSLFWFLLKTYALVFFFIWARATMPRIRIDQIMFFSWKFLLPASVVAVGIAAMGVVYRHPWFSANRIWDAARYRYEVVTTEQALTMLSAPERAFFWGYTVLTVLFTLFILWLAWRVLFGARRHPLPRREVTWS